MTSTLISARTFRLMRHYALASTPETPDLSPGVVVYEHWTTVTHDGQGNSAEVWDETRTEVGLTVAFDDEWGTVPGEPGVLNDDEVEEAMLSHGFVTVGEWTRQDDGQWRADADYYDPTP